MEKITPLTNEDVTWHVDAVCRDEDPELFFKPDGERGRAREQRIRRAKEICRRCPVIQECLAEALGAGDAHGIWGGTSEDERQKLLRRQSPARRVG